MIALVVVIGIAVALSVAGWVPVVRDAVRAADVRPDAAFVAEPQPDAAQPATANA